MSSGCEKSATANLQVQVGGSLTWQKLSPAEFNSYKLKSGEEFDFSEFTNAQKFYKEARPITKMLNKLRGILRNIKKKPGSKMIMLTARRNFDNKELFLKTFRKFGIDIDNIRVERAGTVSYTHLTLPTKA